MPFVSIIIVNYNGKHLLRECLSSVFSIDYPQEKYEVIVVDNDSSDDSVPFIRKYFPNVILLESKSNLGFTGGNQLGFSYATGEYIVLLNSDTRVDPHWLTGLVKAAKPKNIGMVNSKLYFATPFLPLHLHSSVVMRSEVYKSADFSPLGILLEDIVCDDSNLDPLVWYENGFYEKRKGEIECRWTKGDATILVPFPPTKSSTSYLCTVHGYPTDSDLTARFSFSVDGLELVSDAIAKTQVKQYRLTIRREDVEKKLLWLVQNTGNVVLSNAYGKDRGSLLHKGRDRMEEFYEHDDDLFSKPANILACCGASCLIKREVIEEIGFFDQSYYMYYEDLDLSLRAWRKGWDLVYEPTSVVYHKHKSTVKDTSNFSFLYHVEKNHLAFAIAHFPLLTIVLQSLALFIRFLIACVFMSIYLFSENLTAYEGWRQIYEARKRAVLFILKNIPQLIRKRIYINSHSVRGFAQMQPMLY